MGAYGTRSYPDPTPPSRYFCLSVPWSVCDGAIAYAHGRFPYICHEPIREGDVKMRAPFFLVTIVTVLALPCGPWLCNASKSFGIYTAAFVILLWLFIQMETRSRPRTIRSTSMKSM